MDKNKFHLHFYQWNPDFARDTEKMRGSVLSWLGYRFSWTRCECRLFLIIFIQPSVCKEKKHELCSHAFMDLKKLAFKALLVIQYKNVFERGLLVFEWLSIFAKSLIGRFFLLFFPAWSWQESRLVTQNMLESLSRKQFISWLSNCKIGF